MKYIIGNWKANKNITEVNQWLDTFLSLDHSIIKQSTTVIVCPPYPFIPLMKERLKGLQYVHIGAQDVSLFDSGAYTGEVPARSLEDLVEYVLIGHSERRQHCNETNETLIKKVTNLIESGIKPIYCVRGIDDPIPDEITIVAYEPVWAIGTGATETIENIILMKSQLGLSKDTTYIYGGSVTEKNASEFLNNDAIDGILPGGASLDPVRFYDIIKTC